MCRVMETITSEARLRRETDGSNKKPANTFNKFHVIPFLIRAELRPISVGRRYKKVE